jgi:TP901 family phage tail tape measure protein
MPSPKAFSQAGQTIGSFAAKMYGNLNKTSLQSASKTLDTQKKSLAAAQNSLKKHIASQQSYVEAGTKGQLDRIKKLYGDVSKAAMGSAGAMKGLKATMGSTKAAGKLFANVSKDLKDANDYATMMKNFSKLQKEERAEIFATFEARKKAFQRLISTSAKRKELGQERVQEIRDEIATLQTQEDEFKGFDKARTNADAKYTKKKKEHLDDIKDATEGVTEAQRTLEQAERDQLVVQEHLINSANDMAITMKTNFVDAVRESISALTALYYKLQQNSQELIEFERELMNANSVFRVTNSELFTVGDSVVQFGQQFGLEMQNGATGLYQLASAGLSAADSMTVLQDTLKLSMAVQGDHNTISKLVTQTLFGFEMEMDQATIVADKFAYAIQKSLIEYQDLASAVKFALPFFTTTGQSIDQLLGALQILTNRALEAGIAGRGLRQGVAELAESIGDSSAQFKEFGVEVVDAQGNMLQLTEIAANFSKVLDEGIINDTELLTTLIQDLNVRGATAFVHLVQASDEFTAAVEATAGAGGELDEMVKIQNQSIASQVQILRNNISMMFLYRDAAYDGTQYLNAFHESILNMVHSMRDLLVVTNGTTYELTEFGMAIQNFAIKGIKELDGILQNVLPLAERFLEVSKLGVQVLEVYLIPVKLIVRALEIMGPELTKMLISFHLINKIMPVSTMLTYAYSLATLDKTKATSANIAVEMQSTLTTNTYKNALITSLFWQKLVTWWKGVDTVATTKSTAATVYAQGLKKLGFTLDAAEAANLTKKTFLRKLETHGIVLEASAVHGLRHQKTVNLALDSQSITVGGKKILVQKSSILATGADSAATGVNSGAKATNTAVTWGQWASQMADNVATFAGAALKWLYTAALWALYIVMLPVTIAMWALAAAELAVTWPIVLIVAGVVLLVATLYVMGKAINEQIDVMFYLKEMVSSLIGMWIWWGKVMVTPFIWAAEAIYGFLEGPMFQIGLTIGHFFKMLMWYFKGLVKWITQDAGSSLASVLMAPFNACKDAVLWLVGVLYSNEDSLWNRLKAIVTWMDEKFGLADKFTAVKDAAVDMWNWIKDNITWDNIKVGLSAVGTGIANAMLAPLRGVEFAWNWVVDSISGKGFTVWNPVPGDNDFKLNIPNLSSWKINLSDKIAEQLGMANGGYVQAMANGGMASLEGKFPYLVGEEGPELFSPSTPGRIMPNKDLNTQRVNNMLRDAFDLAPRAGAADKTNRMGTLYIDKLEASSAKMKKSRFGVDTFA